MPDGACNETALSIAASFVFCTTGQNWDCGGDSMVAASINQGLGEVVSLLPLWDGEVLETRKYDLRLKKSRW